MLGRPARQAGRTEWEFFFLAIVAVSIAALAGCARLNLPAIDPSGQRIFLPFPSTTQLAPPHLHARDGEPGIIPEPSFPTPATPPPCLAADGGYDEHGICNLFGKKKLHKFHEHFNKKSPGKLGEIQLTPTRVVAPVGGEVVLLAGLCGNDGYFVRKQPLEWMLSPDSVGQFIEVGDDLKGKHCGSFGRGPKVEKLDVDFARGRTSSRETLITRGTPNCDDDIALKDGQTWLSISSPSEGVSRVTALAPDSELWDHRRQTATIYWVDAQWQFPSVQAVRTGQVAELVTRVTRAENLVPAEGWFVRYTIVDPAIAAFEPTNGSNVAVVKVNPDGQAIVRLAALQGTNGTTPVVIEVIRPAQPTDNLPELALGRGQTAVTFSSPRLKLDATGPKVATIGETLTYVASLANSGDIDAENVRLVARLPAGVKLLSAEWQPTSATPDGLIWEQGILGAQRQLDVTITLSPQQAATFDVQFSAVGAQGLTADTSVRTEVIQPTVNVRFTPAGGVAQAEVGQVIEYEIDVTNTGPQTLTDLRLLIESDPGLPEAYQSMNKVEQPIPLLAPGQSFPIGVAFAVRQQGQLGAKLQVLTGSGAILADKSASVLGLPTAPKKPEMEIEIRFANSIRLGDQASNAEITVRNTGKLPLSGIVISVQHDTALVPETVDAPNRGRVQKKVDGVDWTPPDLGLGQFAQLVLGFRGTSPKPQATISARGQSAEGAQDQKQATVAITSGSSPEGQVLPPGSDTDSALPQQRTGNLQIALFDFDDPVEVGKEVRYGLRVTNNQNSSDRNLAVQLRLPQGVRLQSVSQSGTPVQYNYVADRVDLVKTPFIRQQESIEYIIVIIPSVPGQISLAARAFTDNQPQPVEKSVTTTVNARK